MNKGFIKVIECFYALIYGEDQHLPEDEDFKSFDKKELMGALVSFANLFDNDFGSKPIALYLDNEEDFNAALKLIMKNQSLDAESLEVEKGPRFIIGIPFFDDIHKSLTIKKGSELLPVFRNIKGKFSFEFEQLNSPNVLCTGSGENGLFTFAFNEVTIRLPKTLNDLADFGYDLGLLLEISKDLDFILNNVPIKAV